MASPSKSSRVVYLSPDREIGRRVRRTLRWHPRDRFEVATAATLEDALEQVKSADVALLDLGLAGSGGLVALRALALAAPQVPVVVLAANRHQTLEALRLGAADHLSRSASFERLLPRALRHAAEKAAAEKVVRSSEARLASLFANSPLAVEEYDHRGTMVRVNDAARDTFGMEEALPAYNLFTSPYLRVGVSESLRAGMVYRDVIVFAPDHTAIKTRNKRPVWLSATIFPTADSAGKLTGYYAVYEDITQRKAAERDLEERIAHEEALTAISALFLNLEHKAVDDAVCTALGILARYSGADSAYLFRVHGGGGLISHAYSWVNDETDVATANWQAQPTSGFTWLSSHLDKEGFARIDDVQALPGAAAAERLALQAAGLSGAVFAGIRREGRLEGFLCLGTSGRKRPFPESALALARLVGEIAAGAVARSRAESAADKLRQSLLSAREDERARVARAIHDELGARLTGIRYDLAWLARRLPAKDDLRAKAVHTAGAVDEIISAVRRLASDLRPAVLDDLGLVAALEWWAQSWEESTGIPCRLDLHPDLDTLGGAQSSAVFRVAQEALTNAARHAGAPKFITVTSKRQNGALKLEITDNGKGFDREVASAGEGIGLAGMHEHAQMAGGSLQVVSRPGRGTAVRLTLPLEGRQ